MNFWYPTGLRIAGYLKYVNLPYAFFSKIHMLNQARSARVGIYIDDEQLCQQEEERAALSSQVCDIETSPKPSERIRMTIVRPAKEQESGDVT